MPMSLSSSFSNKPKSQYMQGSPNSWVKLRAAQPKKPPLTQGGTQRRGAMRPTPSPCACGAPPGLKVPGVELCGDGQEGRSSLVAAKW